MKKLGRPKVKGMKKKIGISISIYPDLFQRIKVAARMDKKSASEFISEILESNIRLKYYNDSDGILRKRK